jgi:hypothetical protein
MNARTVTRIARYVLGGGFALFGLNGFLNFLPAFPLPAAATNFASALFVSGYFFPLLKTTETVAGVLLLSNRFVPLALALLAPVLVNIIAFHAFLAPAGLPIPVVLLTAELYLAWSYRDAFAPMLQARVEPSHSLTEPISARTAGAVA